MKIFQTVSLRNKLILATLIPVTALIYYLQLNIRQELNKKKAAQQVLVDVAEIQEISKVLHELQKERALSLSLVSSGGSVGRDQVTEQRETTDQSIAALEKVLTEHKRSVKTLSALDSLPPVRAKVDALRPIAEIGSFYYNSKRGLLDEISMVLRSTSNIEIKNRFEEHLSLLYTKDFLAQIRTELGRVIASGKFEGNGYGNFASVKGEYEFNLQKFKKIASPDLRDYFNKKYQGANIQQTFAIIDSAYSDASMLNARYGFNNWWAASTGSINALKEVEDHSSYLISQRAEEELASANANVTKNVIIGIFVILLIALIKTVIIRGIVSSINSIRQAADKMARGDVDVTLKIGTRDEIGALARSFNQMIAVTKNFSEIADSIGKGNYSSAITVRSEKDTLAIALDRMKNNLERFSEENRLRTWLLTGSTELHDKVRGEKDVKALAQDVIFQLASYLKAQIGAMYINDNGTLTLVGTYAYNYRKDNANSFEIGQGLVGQAALEKKPIIFSEIPADYIRINSGLGNAVPRNIIVFPFLYDGQVKGVIEIGSTQEFTDLEMQFLNLVTENIGIAFNAAESRTQLKELLEETQRQAEELEAQQEELKQSNEELVEKTELLEKSEAALKVQQEELQQTNEELEEKANLLEEQKEKLEHAKMDLENKAGELEVTSKYKSEFLANMSHELRTPLNSILILAQLLSENKSKTLGKKEVEFARNIHNSGNDLLNLINEILDLSKVESGKMELDIEDVSLNEIRTDISAMFSEVANSKSIDLSIVVNEQSLPPLLKTDKQRLEQIIRNLLSNAFKFTPKGGKVKLAIEKAPAGVNFKNSKLYNLPNIIAFSVTDTGIGIPEDKQGVIFEAFQQADGSTKRKYGGTGLGLSISRELANALGGEIHLQSQEGKGTTFTLYLPFEFDSSVIIPVERTIEVKEHKSAPPVFNNKTEKIPLAEVEVIDDRYNLGASDKVILIMEDDPDFAKVLLAFVNDRNYKGIIAHEGNTGLSYARHHKPDAIILDMKMPVMDGTEVLKQLKNDPELRHIPVQIISGYDKRKEGLELGAFNFIQKPISKQDLQNAFDQIEDFVGKKYKRLLIVEDNEQQNRAICELIGDNDVKCHSAYSGSDALRMLHKESFECVIVDLGLPDMSGFEFLEKIKTEDASKKVPVIVYTGKDLSKEESLRLNKLANTVVLKTVDSHERLLDETMLFLHRVESRLPKEKQKIIRELHKTGEVLKNKKVLVVDDDIRNIYSLTNILEEEGIFCVTAENGKVALKMLDENPDINMVLMDVMMPEMDGYEATKAIRSMSKYAKLPIIALTAKAMKGDREKCLAAGMSDYIAKPVNIEQLLSLMRVWLYQ